MKFSKLSQLFLACGVGLIVATLLSACALVTIDYVFVAGTSSSSGAVEVFAADSQSGALRAVAGSDKAPFATGGTPTAMAATPDNANIFVATANPAAVVHFTVGTDGKLTQKDKVSLTDSPVALAVGPGGATLYVLSGATTATLQSFALSSGAIGSVAAQQPLTIPGFTGDLVQPTSIAVLANGSAVYATLVDTSAYNPGGSVTSSANPGWIFGFATGSKGALTAVGGSPWRAGVKPSASVAEPTNRFIYVTDFASNQMIGYSIMSSNVLNFLISGPYKTGSQPSAVAIDPRGRYLYVSNSLDSSVTAFAIDIATGIPSQALNTTGSQTNATDTQPMGITVDPALGRFVYTANFLGNSISGFRLNTNTGALTLTQATPYPSLSKSTAILAVPHGNHSVQVVPQ